MELIKFYGKNCFLENNLDRFNFLIISIVLMIPWSFNKYAFIPLISTLIQVKKKQITKNFYKQQQQRKFCDRHAYRNKGRRNNKWQKKRIKKFSYENIRKILKKKNSTLMCEAKYMN